MFFLCLPAVTKMFELIQLAPDRNLVAAAPESQQNLMKLGTSYFSQLSLSRNERAIISRIIAAE